MKPEDRAEMVLDAIHSLKPGTSRSEANAIVASHFEKAIADAMREGRDLEIAIRVNRCIGTAHLWPPLTGRPIPNVGEPCLCGDMKYGSEWFLKANDEFVPPPKEQG